MYLSCLPLALLAIALPVSTSLQTTWLPTSMTLVDALNADPDYTSLLHLLQRTRLIPTLNRINGSTFFAPTNDAIKKHASKSPLWQDVLDDTTGFLPDNVQEQLRQQLLYHLLNETLFTLPANSSVREYKTFLYPRRSPDPPPYPPWMPIPGGTLGGEPQRLRVAANDQGTNVGVDAFGKNGVEITKGVKDAGNGMLFGIADVLEPPPDLGKPSFTSK